MWDNIQSLPMSRLCPKSAIPSLRSIGSQPPTQQTHRPYYWPKCWFIVGHRLRRYLSMKPAAQVFCVSHVSSWNTLNMLKELHMMIAKIVVHPFHKQIPDKHNKSIKCWLDTGPTLIRYIKANKQSVKNYINMLFHIQHTFTNTLFVIMKVCWMWTSYVVRRVFTRRSHVSPAIGLYSRPTIGPTWWGFVWHS